MRRALLPALGLLLASLASVAACHAGTLAGHARAAGWLAPRTVAEVLAELGPDEEAAHRPKVEAAGVSWPPRALTLVALKDERRLEVWAEDGPRKALLEVLPITAASGGPGPKLREGDRQVPEGIYGLPSLNPNSRFHLSLAVGYPSPDDVRHATVPRAQLGSAIMVHGGASSIGCVAVGDGAIERVFALAARVPAARRRILIAPWDLRVRRERPTGVPGFMAPRYDELERELARYQ